MALKQNNSQLNQKYPKISLNRNQKSLKLPRYLVNIFTGVWVEFLQGPSHTWSNFLVILQILDGELVSPGDEGEKFWRLAKDYVGQLRCFFFNQGWLR